MLPTIGWQLDPFGHSSTNAALMTGALGFDATFFGRADYQVGQGRWLNANWLSGVGNSSRRSCSRSWLAMESRSMPKNNVHAKPGSLTQLS